MGNQRDREALSMCQYIYFGIFWRLAMENYSDAVNPIIHIVHLYVGCLMK